MLPLRLRRVAGYEGRVNDTLFQPARERPPDQLQPDANTLVYFGGDVQDYPEVMAAHRDNRHYQQWNLERTARLLGRGFPYHHILVVRPSRIELKSISCYDNFVPSNHAGVPDHTPTYHALSHLERLLQNVSVRIKQMSTSELLEAVSSLQVSEETDREDHKSSVNQPADEEAAANIASATHTPDPNPLWWRDKLALDQSRLTLVGFSKGCVVLNQFIYEFHYTKTLTPGDVHTMRFMSRVCAMWWVDGGHAAGKNTWLTARSLLQTLATLGVNIYVHVSPYQVRDESRPWIGREEKAFTNMLRKMGAKISRHLHEGKAPYSLQTHFNVLANFKRVQDSAPAPSPPIDSSEEGI